MYSFVFSHSIIIVVLTSLLITFLTTQKYLKKAKVYLVLSFVFVILLFTFKIIPLMIMFFPMTIIPVIAVISTLMIILSKYYNIRNKTESNLLNLKYYLIIKYILSLGLLLLAIVLSSTSANTWGVGYLPAGEFMIVFIVPLLHLLRIIRNQNKIYGIINIIFGFLSFVLVAVNGFSYSEYNGYDIYLARLGVVLLIVGLTIEGFLLVFYSQNKILNLRDLF